MTQQVTLQPQMHQHRIINLCNNFVNPGGGGWWWKSVTTAEQLKNLKEFIVMVFHTNSIELTL